MDEIYFGPILGAKGTVIEREGGREKKITGACSGRERSVSLLAGWLAGWLVGLLVCWVVAIKVVLALWIAS